MICYPCYMFQGNRDLSDVTHVVVDEVHERTILVFIHVFYPFSCCKTSNMFLCWMRYLNDLYFSLQSDFLLIVLENLIEKHSNQQGRKLKVILMYNSSRFNIFTTYINFAFTFLLFCPSNLVLFLFCL